MSFGKMKKAKCLNFAFNNINSKVHIIIYYISYGPPFSPVYT